MRCLIAFAFGVLGFGGTVYAQRGGTAHGGSVTHSGFAPVGGLGSFRGPGQPGFSPQQSQRLPNAFSYGRSFAVNHFPGTRQSYPGFWLPPQSLYSARSQWGPPPMRSNAGTYPRVASYGLVSPFSPSVPDTCFYGCPDQNLADGDVSSWADPGGPDPQTNGSPAYSASSYGAQVTPYAAQATQPYTVPYLAPYPPQPVYGTIGAAQPMVLVPVSRQPNPPEEEETVTLVYKDGRPPLQIRNYILTRSAIYLTGKHFNEIPLSDLDLQATQKVNWDAGVTFRLP